MNNETRERVAELIELINRATPDSLLIAQAILKKNPLIQIPQLPLLKKYVENSLTDKTNRQLSEQVRILKTEILVSLTASLPTVSILN